MNLYSTALGGEGGGSSDIPSHFTYFFLTKCLPALGMCENPLRNSTVENIPLLSSHEIEYSNHLCNLALFLLTLCNRWAPFLYLGV